MGLRLLNRSSLWLFMFFINSPVISLGSNILTTTDKPLTLAVTLVSTNGRFEMGFFTPGNSSVYYAGIWYRQIAPQTVVWVANRRAPISSPDMDSAQLNIIDGNLVLRTRSGKSIWSTNLKFSKNSVQATLLDTGNLVLTGGAYSNATPPLWQSFDHPTDTFMPGMKMVPGLHLISWSSVEQPAMGNYTFQQDEDTDQFVIYNSQSVSPYWKSGTEAGGEKPTITSLLSNLSQGISTVHYNLPNKRLVLSFNGFMQFFVWLETGKQWVVIWSEPQYQCSVYNVCGNFGICSTNNNNELLCKCLPGYVPECPEDWKAGKYSCGCYRKSFTSCNQNITFNTLESMEFQNPDTVSHSKSEEECRAGCSTDCQCLAYSFTKAFSNVSSTCRIWTTDIKDLQDNIGNGLTLTVRVAIPDKGGPVSVSEAQGSSNKTKGSSVLLRSLSISISAVIAVSLSCSLGCIIYRRNLAGKIRGMPKIGKQEQDLITEDDMKAIEVPFFCLGTILAATDNFSYANKLGQGGFGPVYKGNFPGGQMIAVKRLLSNSGQGVDEFKNEVMLIAKLQHRNLVKLLGYCITTNEKILLYEYMPNKSLDVIIFDQTLSVVLDWKMRFDIIFGIARGLLYLHQDSRLRIIHRDLKVSNILLDEEMNPKISDFGLARIVEGKSIEANTNKIAGTFGYMPPEYALEGLFSIKSDVFSFGVVVLEIISGRKNTSFYQSQQVLNLLGHVWKLWMEEMALDMMDTILLKSCNASEILKCIHIGLLCVQEDPSDRPTMSDVVRMFGTEGRMNFPTPNEPAFVARKRISRISPSTNPNSHSKNEFTVTVLEGR